jgi:hypothetical protein
MFTPTSDQTITRRNRLRRTYTLKAEDYANLIAQGLDPETVDEALLIEHAQEICHYDEQDRLSVVYSHAVERTTRVYDCDADPVQV